MRRLRIAGVLIAAGLTVAASAEAEQVAPREYVVVYKAGASAGDAHAGDRAGGRDDRRGERGDRRGHGAFGRRGLRGRGREPTGARGRGLQHADRPGAARPGQPPRGDRAAVEGAQGPRCGRKAGKPAKVNADPLASLQWDMQAIGATADGSYKRQQGSRDVRVGIIDTGVDASHPDIAPNFDKDLSRNFTVDDPVVDGAVRG